MLFLPGGGRVFFRRRRPPAYHPLLPLSRMRSQGPVGVFLYAEGWGALGELPAGGIGDKVAKNATKWS